MKPRRGVTTKDEQRSCLESCFFFDSDEDGHRVELQFDAVKSVQFGGGPWLNCFGWKGFQWRKQKTRRRRVGQGREQTYQVHGRRT